MTLVNAFEVADPDPKTIGILKMTKKLVPLLPARQYRSFMAGGDSTHERDSRKRNFALTDCLLSFWKLLHFADIHHALHEPRSKRVTEGVEVRIVVELCPPGSSLPG